MLLGAGFDARAHRMPEIQKHGATVFEVDFAEQLERKQTILAESKITLPGRPIYVPCDFNQPDFDEALTTSLVEGGFRKGAGAIFVWEGVMRSSEGDGSSPALARAELPFSGSA